MAEQKNDYMIRAMARRADAPETEIRAFAVTARDVAEEARKAHETSPVVTAGLGRLLCGALMMGDMLKEDDDLLTLRIDGDLLKSGDHTILASAPEGAAAHLAIDQNSLAIDGRKFSLEEKDGALVLNIVPIPGLMIIVR